MREWWRKLSGQAKRNSRTAELREEMQSHLEMRAAELGDFDAARRKFGNTTRLLEDAHSAWGWPSFESWLKDFRFAFRALARKPGFTLTVVLTLFLGIAASSTIFSLIDAVLIRPLPYPDSDRLVSVHESKPGDSFAQTPVSPGRLEDWQQRTSTFEALAGSSETAVTDTTGGTAERINSAMVSPRFFEVLRTSPETGRTFQPEEERFGGPAAVVISHGFWRRRFGGTASAIGRSLVLDMREYVITGVMPPGFQYPSPDVDLWIPRQAPAELLRLREARIYNVAGRLKPGVTVAQAAKDLASIQRRLGDEYPKTDAGWSAAVEPLKDQLVGPVRLALWFLFGSACLLLAISCANAACLLLAKLNGRATEIATRRSLGASRAAIARQLFAEGFTYAVAAGLLGFMAAFAGIDLLRKELPDLPRISELKVDTGMLAAALGISMATAMVFSLAPIFETLRQNLTALLIHGGRGLTSGRQLMPRILVAAQIALATALVIGAGLFLRSLAALGQAPLGFHPAGILTLRVGASSREPVDATIARHQRLLDALSSLPGVDTVAMSAGLPGVNPTWPREFEIEGEPAPGGTLRFAGWRIVTAGYFQTIGIPILEGRTCRMSTDPKHAFEALVNQSFIARYSEGRDPIGRVILGGPQGDSATRIVGVVADAREDGYFTPPQPVIYACGFLRFWPDSEILVRSAHAAALPGAVRRVLNAVDPGHPVYSMGPFEAALRGSLAQTRFRTLLVGIFSIMALGLAGIGLYGVMAYSVSQRTKEIGIRVALGARPGQIVRELLRSGLMFAGCGIAAGAVMAAAATGLMRSLLFGIQPGDPAAYLSAIAVLFAVALFACWIPSRRATSIDPNLALRGE